MEQVLEVKKKTALTRRWIFHKKMGYVLCGEVFSITRMTPLEIIKYKDHKLFNIYRIFFKEV